MSADLFAPQGRWRVYTGAVAGPLLRQWTSSKVQVPRTGVGGFELVYPTDGPDAHLLTDDYLAALGYETMAADGSWHEPANCRFLPLRRTYDAVNRTVTVSGASMGWLAGKVVRWPDTSRETDGKVVFTAESAGQILQWLYYFAMLRQTIRNLAMDWDAFLDSDAQPWAEVYTMDLERGVTWRQVIDGFATDGLVWRTSGWTMQLAQGGFADELATTPILYDGIDVTLDRVEVSIEDAAGTVLATGKDGYWGHDQVTTLPAFGRWEVATTASDVAHGSTLDRVAESELARRGLSRESAMVTLLPSARFRPFDTVGPGQTITVISETPPVGPARWDVDRWDSGALWGGPQPWWRQITGRIEEVTITDDGKAATVSLAIGEQTRSATDLLTRSVAAITGGRVARGALAGRA